MIKLYTIDCPRCKVLEAKLNQKGIKYEVVKDIEILKKLGLDLFPVLEVDNKKMDFSKAIKWLQEQGEGDE